MEKIGFIHFAFIYIPIGYYYLVADANDKKWTFNQSQLRSIDFDFQIEYHKSIVCYSVQHSLWARCINIQNNDAIHEQTRDPGTDYYWYSSCSRPIFFLLFFFFYFSLTLRSTCMWCAFVANSSIDFWYSNTSSTRRSTFINRQITLSRSHLIRASLLFYPIIFECDVLTLLKQISKRPFAIPKQMN